MLNGIIVGQSFPSPTVLEKLPTSRNEKEALPPMMRKTG
jgi:hypothetical protein